MKRLILSALVLITITNSSFARNIGDNNDRILSSFYKDYSNAKNVTIEAKKEIVKITFNIDGQKMFAYYQPGGEQVAVSRNILSNQLPLKLASTLKAKLNNKWLTDLFEVSKNGETSYYASIEDAGTRTILQADASGYWQYFSKTKKDIE